MDTPQHLLPLTARRPAFRLGAMLLGLYWIAGCDGSLQPVGPSGQPASNALFLISPPVPQAPGSGGAGFAAAAGDSVVYVSAAPGSLPGGTSVLIHVVRTGASTTVPVVNGGFDPVALQAVLQDTIRINVTGATEPTGYTVVVPESSPPVVVRSDPQPNKRDVPLNASIRLVFSEPIDAASLTPSTVQLRTGGTHVPGTLQFADASHTTALFIADSSLHPSTVYEVDASQGVRDLGGNALSSTLSTTFTTVSLGAASGIHLVFTVQPSKAEFSQVVSPAVRVTAQDSSGNTATTFSGTVTVALAANSTNAALTGTLLSTAVNGVATFPSLAVDQSGSGFKLIATATGSIPATSAGFDVTASEPGPAGRIAFASTDNATGTPTTSHIYVLDLHSSSPTRLTNGPVYDDQPAWSPDGTRIAFTRSDAALGTAGTFVMNADGSAVTQVTLSGDSPTWSPDGSKLLIRSFNDLEFYAVNLDGSGLVKVSSPTPGIIGKNAPAWSPNGAAIAFNAAIDIDSDDSFNQVYLMAADGTNVRRLTGPTTYGGTNTQSAESYPSWSPDGTRVLIWSFGFGITSVNPGDGSAVSLTHESFGATHNPPAEFYPSNPDWSPDGRWVVFTKPDRQLWLVTADGSATEQVITALPGGANNPSWSRRP